MITALTGTQMENRSTGRLATLLQPAITVLITVSVPKFQWISIQNSLGSFMSFETNESQRRVGSKGDGTLPCPVSSYPVSWSHLSVILDRENKALVRKSSCTEYQKETGNVVSLRSLREWQIWYH